MPYELPPLSTLRAFEAAARHASFVRAGEELFVTAGAVGHQVRLLEEWLGTALFVRGPRSVQITETGRRYQREISRMLEELERVSLAVRGAGDAKEVTVTAMPSFVTRWLMPRLGDFRQKHPEVEVRLLASVPPVDFARDRVDVAIRLGSGSYPELHSELLLRESFCAIAQPDVCRGWKKIGDILQATLLHDEYEPRIPLQVDWSRWWTAQDARPLSERRIRQGLRFSHTYLTIDAATGAEGVAVASDVLAADAVRTGRLAMAPGEPVPGPYAYHLLTPRTSAMRPQVKSFCDWLRVQAKEFSEAGWPRHPP
ncbi:transcriptional regulator GcvA [Variovorax sp. 22077]|uniref:transcriptional regulator GcvA n=1 Tax=Variovorax sp. 22077 TaxID=3453867 RepID=UPI003F877554